MSKWYAEFGRDTPTGKEMEAFSNIICMHLVLKSAVYFFDVFDPQAAVLEAAETRDFLGSKLKKSMQAILCLFLAISPLLNRALPGRGLLCGLGLPVTTY